MKKIIPILFVSFFLTSCFKAANEASMAKNFEQTDQRGLLVGSFTVTGFAESAPRLEFTDTTGKLSKSITANRGMFGYKTDAHRGAASLFAIKLKPGNYFFRNVSMKIVKTAGVFTHINEDHDE